MPTWGAEALSGSMHMHFNEPVVLNLKDVSAWYGQSRALHGVDFSVHQGEVVALLGRNGAGRTTTLRTVLGLVGKRTGLVEVFGQDICKWPSYRIARLGVGYCPEERGIFSKLTCEENLRLPWQIKASSAAMSLDDIYQLFPNLAERRHSKGLSLSGGEQQMLAVARILRTGARLLLLDEISEGLAPVIVERLAAVIQTLRKMSFTILLVEQNMGFAASLADRLLVMEHGRVIKSLSSAELEAQRSWVQAKLSI